MYNTILTPSTSVTLQDEWMAHLADRAYVTIGDPQGVVGPTATGSPNEQYIINNTNAIAARLASSDLAKSCKRIPWVTGKIWPAYRSTVVEETHVETLSGSVVHVFKCLGNNSGGVSTVEPAVINQTTPFTTADGYVWMYLFTVSESQINQFATVSALPIFANTAVQSAAVGGTVDTYVIEDKGLGYVNTYSGAFAQSDIRVGSTVNYRLGADASSTDDFYNGCRLEITSGSAIGQHAKIIDYVGSTRVATLDVALTTTPATNDSYEVSPDVAFGVNANAVAPVARAIITNGQVSSIRALSRGRNVRSATAQVVSHFSATPTVDAELTVHPSPSYGHGGRQDVEVLSNGILIGKSIDLADSSLPRTGTIGVMTVIADPVFTNVAASVSSSLLFKAGETVNISTPVGVVSSNATVNGTSLTISDTPTANLSVGSTAIVAAGSRRVVVSIQAKANSTSFTVSPSVTTPATGSLFAGTEIKQGEVVTVSASNIRLNTVPVFNGDAVYGVTSGSGSLVTSIAFDGAGNYSQAVDVWTLDGSVTAGNVAVGQVITQGSNSGLVFSKQPDDSAIYVVGKLANFEAGAATTTTGTYTISDVTPPMTNLETGSLLLVSAFAPISIDNNEFYCKHHLLI